MTTERTIAYFSMEIGVQADTPTYSGGLGILAGDTIRSAADLKIPMVAVTLLYRKGYFFQRLSDDGWQTEEPTAWSVNDVLVESPGRTVVHLEGREVQVRSWLYTVTGVGGGTVPVYFLDTDLPENMPADRALTDTLYGGDLRYRLAQEVILGIGGVRMLRALGFGELQRFQMNEGHASLLTLELLNERLLREQREHVGAADIEAVRRQCVFTTHTPVPAGHDHFPLDLADRVLGQARLREMQEVFCCNGELNTTFLALTLSHYVNGVAKKHGEVSRQMFAGYTIDAITNGVHAATWVCPEFAALFDKYIPDWRTDNFSLRYAISIPSVELWQAHLRAKTRLLELVNRETNAGLDLDVLTIGFARRAASYKRTTLLFEDIERLRNIARTAGPLQIIFAGKAHPHDQPGKQMIQAVFRAKAALGNDVRIAYLPNYDMEAGKLLTAGTDVWLNTPQPPMEASGTSGMKAALNGVPSLSILDGWWMEGCIEGVTGWAIGASGAGTAAAPVSDAASLYAKLETVVVPSFYRRREEFMNTMRHCVSINGAFFNTQRMLQQYVVKAYME